MPPMDSPGPHSSELDHHFPNIPTHSNAPTTLRCCCGRDDCLLLEHNNVALDGLEKDLATAARLGQSAVPVPGRAEACMFDPSFASFLGRDSWLLAFPFLDLVSFDPPLALTHAPLSTVELSSVIYLLPFLWTRTDQGSPSSPVLLASVMATFTFHDYSAAKADCLGSSSLTFALQALLHRHESYMAEAEEDRQRLVDTVDMLEHEKRQVQTENARLVEENRSLLEQLDGLNKAVAESDDHVQSLTLTLERTQSELRRLTVAASRAAELEAQLSLMEMEQSKLQENLSSAQDDEKSAVQRWRDAEHAIRDLHDQVEYIEAEAREERERHEELVQRMERKRNVERELDNAAGRLKGAAAASELGRKSGTPVISRFVKDILQDNANLQVGIMELRELLESSNQEVQSLRDQVLTHQPLAGVDEDNAETITTPTLSEELESKERRVSQEFHIHHHYHTPSSRKDKGGPLNRRVKKKRPSLGSPVAMHSAVGTHSPRRSIHRSQSSGSSMNTILSQTSVSIPPPSSSRRWSLHSPQADSLASSPQSAFHTSSIFDRMDRTSDFSQPTSPVSTAFSSPLIGARNKGLDLPFRPLAGLDSRDLPPIDDTHGLYNDAQYERPAYLDLCDGIKTQPAIPEESEPSSSILYSQSTAEEAAPTTEDIFGMQIPYSPLRRSASHDSLLSVAGMDIHTPTSRHSRMGDWHSGMRIPQRLMTPSVELVSTPPIISAPAITADRSTSSSWSSRSLLASVAANKGISTEASSVISADSTSTSSTATPAPRKSTTLGRRMGGWVLGRWGVAPASDDNERSAADASPAEISAPKAHSTPNPTDRTPSLHFRYPGVNQKGPIMGFRPPPRAPVSVHPQGIDEDLLRESLAEEPA
ncbi:uncharacterized protein N7459_006161 [Penicillium hispanicum]|uniref:uncharacterized protein n=1 Tax=Penicillium hispanicum TaxID=1080232 RepID=UPI0025423B0B|nr:uncharacterized protein N7459_006161 [Penicillium hispanicum]KAJ5580176.1 hypothetical protein N7459_006161 [Penicillium hispanicum]